MRVGIDVRPLQVDAYKGRGIGNHLRSWIQAAQSTDTTWNFALLFDPNLPAPQIRLRSRQWRLQPFEWMFAPPRRPVEDFHIDQDEELRFDAALEAFLVEKGFDLFHSTFTFMWETFVGRRLFYTRWVATVYDLIPLVFRDEYWPPEERGRRSFAQRLGAVVYAQRAQTLCRASQSDLVETTGTPPNKIDVLYGGVDEVFTPLANTAETWKSVSSLGIPGPYIFSVLGFHSSKNLRRTLEAFSLLPDVLRQQYHLVILAPLAPYMLTTVRQWLTALGIRDRTILLDANVSQQQLIALYNGATLLAHPTLYEGLGLPILEAMRCGTPVVTSNVSSMPEISGDAAELVDPHQPQDIARGIGRVLQSPALRVEMRERGFRQAAPFTWQRTATAVLDSYAKAAAEPLYPQKRLFPAASLERSRRLRLAFWSPVNPCLSGVSDYSELLVAELGKHADVDVFLDGYQPSNFPLFDSFAMFDAKAFPYLAARQPYDLNIYQVGNNPLHRYMYKHILEQPGLVTFHDVYLYHLIQAALAPNGSTEAFWREVAYCEGDQVAYQARQDYVKGELDNYSMPLNKHIAQSSRGIVVHSEWALQRVAQYEGAPPACVIPFGILPLEKDEGQFAKLIRRLLLLPEDGFIFGVFGNLHQVKRIPVVLRAFARVRARHPKAALFLMGPVASDELRSFERDPQAARDQGIYLYLTYASYDLMLMAMEAVDVGINLRYPTAGETSGTLSMLLGQGKPTLVSDVGSFSEYPDACCPKTPVNDQEEDVLVQHLLALMEDRRLYLQSVQAAYAYSQDKTWAHCAQRYLEFIESLL